MTIAANVLTALDYSLLTYEAAGGSDDMKCEHCTSTKTNALHTVFGDHLPGGHIQLCDTCVKPLLVVEITEISQDNGDTYYTLTDSASIMDPMDIDLLSEAQAEAANFANEVEQETGVRPSIKCEGPCPSWLK